MKFHKMRIILPLVAMVTASAADARDTLKVVGSSTVYPFTAAVIGTLTADGRVAEPDLQSTGTTDGLRLFCEGVGTAYPDIAGASRPMRRAEWEECQANGVESITEVLIGYDGLSLAYAKAAPVEWSFTPRQLYLALAETVPVDGALVTNPHTSWADVDPALPDIAIKVMGPPTTSGTRDVFEEMALDKGCRDFREVTALDAAQADAVCSTIRTDGAYIEASEDDEAIVAALGADPTLIGIFGFSYLYEHSDELAGAAINGIVPSLVTIATQNYPFSRRMFLYVKNEHRQLVPDINTFLSEYVRNAVVPYGYLVELGLTPVVDDWDREQIAGEAMDGEPMAPPPPFF